MATISSPFLKPLCDATIPATDGKRTFLNAKGVQSVDPMVSKIQRPVSPISTPALPAVVCEMVRDSRVGEIVRSIGRPLGTLGLYESQIVEFCLFQSQKLSREGPGSTYFVFKDEPVTFVVRVRVDTSGEPWVYFPTLDSEALLEAKYQHRFVFPARTS